MVATAQLPLSARDTLPPAVAAQQVANSLEAGEIVTAIQDGDAPAEFASTGDSARNEVPVDERLFEIGSISKVFTGLLLAIAVESGAVSLDTSLQELLGDQITFQDKNVGAITLRQLATHTSGLPRLPANLDVNALPEDPYARYDFEALLVALESQTLPAPPPFPEAYSNYGMGLLGALLSEVDGRSWEQMIREEIAQPLGLPDTAMALDEAKRKRMSTGHSGKDPVGHWHFQALAGAGGLRSSARDLVTFGKALRDPETTPLTAPLQLLLEPATDEGGMGLGLFRTLIDGQLVYRHSGATGGFQSQLEIRPATREIEIILMNNTQPDLAAVTIAMRNEQPRKQDSGRSLSHAELEPYTGVYTLSPHAKFTILRHKDQLQVRLTGQPFAPIYPHETPDRFFYKMVPAELQFERDSNKITAVVLHQNGQAQRATKTEAPPSAIRFPAAAELDAYTGRYQMLLGPAFIVERRGKTLFVKLAEQPFVPVFPTETDTFEYDVVDAKLTFTRDKTGEITHLNLHQNGAIQSAFRVEKEATTQDSTLEK